VRFLLFFSSFSSSTVRCFALHLIAFTILISILLIVFSRRLLQLFMQILCDIVKDLFFDVLVCQVEWTTGQEIDDVGTEVVKSLIKRHPCSQNLPLIHVARG